MIRRPPGIGIALATLLCTSAYAQVPVADLAQPPPDARHFVTLSTGGKHGDSWSWVAPDGTRRARESMNLRGQVFEIDYSGSADADGLPRDVTIRGFTPVGDAAETFAVTDGAARWKTPVDGGSTPYPGGAFYATVGGPMDTNAWFIERLLDRPDRRMKLLPGGEARVTRLAELDVGSGPTRQSITLWAVSGLGNSPVPMWTDAQGRFFGMTTGLNWLPDAYVSEMERLVDA